MSTVRTPIARITLCGLALGLGLPGGWDVLPARAGDTCKFFSQLPDDCAGAEQRRYGDLRGARYEEIDLYAKDALKKVPYVSVYNTTGLNGADESRDSAPKTLVERLDPRKIAKQYQALVAATSPPRYWTVDWLVDRVGAVRDFDGLDAAWMGNSQAPASKLVAKPVSVKRASAKPAFEPYRPAFVGRTSIEGFKKGSQVYLLDDPKGRTWVMVSYTDQNALGLTLDKLDSLGDILKLPPGWKFRTSELKKELVLEPKKGSAGVIQDDKDNVYHLTGPGQSNFVPDALPLPTEGRPRISGG
ncbi:MAG TPA: hypothetical protein VFE63_10725 [Roseiarcus sp.]|jgi:hypothetical protein|nr:hypothetical protein [Roseiarcus sp.]